MDRENISFTIDRNTKNVVLHVTVPMRERKPRESKGTDESQTPKSE